MAASEDVLARFLRYVVVHTTSDGDSTTTPSTARQFDLAKLLVRELTEELKLADAAVDEKTCIVTATVPGTPGAPTIALLAHLDTSEDAPGKDVKPRIVTVGVDTPAGSDLMLQGDIKILWEDLKPYAGQRVVVTDGTTLLGADDKAGVSVIISAAKALLKDGDSKPRATLKLIFTPDEEIGRGADNIDVEGLVKQGVACAYTVDGGELGELEEETFNAMGTSFQCTGFSVHPGTAFGKMGNAGQAAVDFAQMLPASQRPETTKLREGYIHLTEITGEVSKATAKFIIRSFDKEEEKKLCQLMEEKATAVQLLHPRVKCELTTRRQYLNMKDYISKRPEVTAKAKEAYAKAGVEVKMIAVRGGTDGAHLSERGLPCPNIFTGGVNFHSKSEFASVESMLKSVEVVKNLAYIWATK